MMCSQFSVQNQNTWWSEGIRGGALIGAMRGVSDAESMPQGGDVLIRERRLQPNLRPPRRRRIGQQTSPNESCTVDGRSPQRDRAVPRHARSRPCPQLVRLDLLATRLRFRPADSGVHRNTSHHIRRQKQPRHPDVHSRSTGRESISPVRKTSRRLFPRVPQSSS